MMPIAASRPFTTLEGKKEERNPPFNKPKMIWRTPASITATRKASNDPSSVICAATTAVKPAAGPATLVLEPLRTPTIRPPTIPAMIPAESGAFEAREIPKQRGKATRNTTSPAGMSLARFDGLKSDNVDIKIEN
jgi:hypothetical protein